MDSPSQPVNNHHVHSHTTTESKYNQLPVRWFSFGFSVYVPVWKRSLAIVWVFLMLSLEQRGSTVCQLTTLRNMFQRRSSSLKLCCPRLHQTALRRTHQVTPCSSVHLHTGSGCYSLQVCSLQVAVPTVHQYPPTTCTMSAHLSLWHPTIWVLCLQDLGPEPGPLPWLLLRQSRPQPRSEPRPQIHWHGLVSCQSYLSFIHTISFKTVCT